MPTRFDSGCQALFLKQTHSRIHTHTYGNTGGTWCTHTHAHKCRTFFHLLRTTISMPLCLVRVPTVVVVVVAVAVASGNDMTTLQQTWKWNETIEAKKKNKNTHSCVAMLYYFSLPCAAFVKVSCICSSAVAVAMHRCIRICVYMCVYITCWFDWIWFNFPIENTWSCFPSTYLPLPACSSLWVRVCVYVCVCYAPFVPCACLIESMLEQHTSLSTERAA